MLNLNPDYISSIIQKARQYHVKEEADVAEEASNPSDDFFPEILAFTPDDNIYDELKIMIEDLDPDQKATLLALLWVGRGDYDIGEWQTAYRNARKVLPTTSVDEFLGKPQLADFIEEGLNQYELAETSE